MLCQLSVWYFGTKSSTFDTSVYYDRDIFLCVLMLCTQVNIMFLKKIVFRKVLKSFRRVLKSKNSLKS
jgi:hypothetical protein